MAKAPLAGASKTRLVPALSAEAAAELAHCFIRDAVALGRSVSGASVRIAYTPADEVAYFRRYEPEVSLVLQEGAHLGDRLAHVMTAALADGHDQVVAVNSDGPTLAAARLDEAFSALSKPGVDVVLGPADDGGYYLIGWKRPHPRMVREVVMSTPTVLDDTLAIAGEDGLRAHLLDGWYDVDEPADLARLQADLAAGVPCGLHTKRFMAQLDRAGWRGP